ncbi:MAG: hypothetical protein Q7T30_00790 [Planctomycetota bacterium]|nr:hypothetical protein [Planctomycetota bacterium]
MGLDSVELVMEWERFFEISFTDEDASQIHTVGDATDFVTRTLAELGRPRPREVVFEQVCAITCVQCGTTRDQLTESTSFVHDLGID